MTRIVIFLALLSLSLACNRQQRMPPPAPTDPGGSMVVAYIGDRAITLAEVDKAAGRDLFELRERTLENLLNEQVIAVAAKKAGLDPEAFVRREMEARVPEVTEEEAARFFAQNKDRLGPQLAGKQFAEVRPMIIQGLTGEKRQEALASFLEELRTRAGVRVLLEAPRVQVAATGPSRGPQDAKVTIVEFSDFQCPYCARARQTLEQVMKEYGDKVRLVFRDFPLGFHEHAQKAAEAGQCAHEQGKFWAMHDWMFDNQKSLAVPDLKNAARKLGLQGEAFDRCLDSGKHAALVAENLKAGQQAGVRGTPAFFINGRFINGAQPFETFKKEIDRALASPP